MPIRNVLVPLDGTPFAEHALAAADALARRAGGALVLLRVRPTAPPPSSELAALAQEARGDDADAREGYVRALAERLRARGTRDVRGLVRDGPLARTVREVCEGEGIDLVVLAGHARGALGQLLAASAARDIVDEMQELPALVVRGHDDAPPADAPPTSHLLVSIDDATPVTLVVAAAVDLARLTDAAVTFVSVRPPARGVAGALLPTFLPAHADGRSVDESPAAARDDLALLEQVAERVASYGIRTSTRLVEGDDAAEALAECAGEVGADVVVAGARGHAADVLRHAVGVPVLLAPARGRDAGA